MPQFRKSKTLQKLIRDGAFQYYDPNLQMKYQTIYQQLTTYTITQIKKQSSIQAAKLETLLSRVQPEQIDHQDTQHLILALHWIHRLERINSPDEIPSNDMFFYAQRHNIKKRKFPNFRKNNYIRI